MTEGKRFSQIYLEKGIPLKDSRRMRNRISAYYWDALERDSSSLVQLIHKETGAKVPYSMGGYMLTEFFEECEVRDLLDSVTLIYKYYKQRNNQQRADNWVQFASRVFKEENVGYRIDNQGGVHFFIDEEFENNKLSTIASLSHHPAVLETFEQSYDYLDQDPPHHASAIRSMFEAIEILYKHIIDAERKERLNSIGVQKNLKSLSQQKLAGKPVELAASDHMLDGLCDWIDAGHMYRHGQKIEEVEEPSIEFTVLFISQGATYIRYLLQYA